MDDMCIMIMSSVSIADDANFGTKVYGDIYDRVFSGYQFFACLPENRSKLWTMLQRLDDEGKTDAIAAIWMFPKRYVNLYDTYQWSDGIVKVENCYTDDVK